MIEHLIYASARRSLLCDLNLELRVIEVQCTRANCCDDRPMAVKKIKRTVVRKSPKKQAIRRAVASSTAIETGQSVKVIERKLRTRSGKYRHVSLAE